MAMVDSDNNYSIVFTGNIDLTTPATSFTITTTGIASSPTGGLDWDISVSERRLTTPGIASGGWFGSSSTITVRCSQSQDLFTFGGTVPISKPSWFDDNLEIESGLPVATADSYGVVKKSKYAYQETSPATVTGNVAGLGFTNLEIGKTYRYTLDYKVDHIAVSPYYNLQININNAVGNSNTVREVQTVVQGVEGVNPVNFNDLQLPNSSTGIFTATDSNFNVYVITLVNCRMDKIQLILEEWEPTLTTEWD
jgi:hypothetical protein